MNTMKILLSSVLGSDDVDDSLHFLAENLQASAVVLDSPSEERFLAEIKKDYDYVGIWFIVSDFIKAQRMAGLVRRCAPRSQIILGGDGSRRDNVTGLIPHDQLCGEQEIRFWLNLLDEPVDAPVRQPLRALGIGVTATAR